MFRNLARFSIRYRIPVMVFFLGCTLFMGSRIPGLEFDPNIISMLPDNIDARDRMDRIEEIFGGTEFILVGFLAEDVLSGETLERTAAVTGALERTKGIEKVLSLSNVNNIAGRNGDLVVSRLIRSIPAAEAPRERLKEDILQNDMVYRILVSEDFRASVIIAFLEEGADDAELLGELKGILAEHPGEEQVHLGGLPIIRAELTERMQRDMSRFLPLGLLIMLIFLFLCFRELRGVLLPFLIVVMSIIVAMGAISLLGWKIQLVTIILPVILIAVANDYGIHLLARYQQEVLPLSGAEDGGEQKRAVIEKVVVRLGGPVFAAGLTTAAGFLTLLTHIVTPAKQLGVLAGIGILYALGGSILFIPAVLSLLPLSRLPEKRKKRGLIDGILAGIGRLVTRRPGRVMLISVILVGIILPGMLFLVVDTDPISFFGPDSEVVRSDNLLSEYFGGSTNISVIARGDILDPAIMGRIDALERELKKRENIGEVTSIARVLRQMNRVMHHGNPAFARIPETREAIAQYFLLYSFGGDPEDFEKMVDFEYTNAMVMARLAHPSTKTLKAEFSFIREWMEKEEDSPFVLLGGFGEILLELSYALVRGQLISLGLSLVVVGVIIALFFRAPAGGALSVLPISLAILTLFGLMGYLGIKLSTVTTMLSSLMIGVGVDYTIHFLWHFRAALKTGRAKEEAVIHTLETSGKGIVFNALSVIIGFLVLLISEFLPIRFFGFLIVTSIFSCLVGALLFLPALCLWIQPRWLERE